MLTASPSRSLALPSPGSSASTAGRVSLARVREEAGTRRLKSPGAGSRRSELCRMPQAWMLVMAFRSREPGFACRLSGNVRIVKPLSPEAARDRSGELRTQSKQLLDYARMVRKQAEAARQASLSARRKVR